MDYDRFAWVPCQRRGVSAVEKAVVLVLDGVGAGEMPDADRYGDRGSDTLGNTARHLGGLYLPNFRELGLGNLHEIRGLTPSPAPRASWGRSAVASPGKDSTTGHWEMMGIVLEKPFPTFPRGFPEDFMGRVSERWGRGWMGNTVESGTEIILRLGSEHMNSGKLIVYTSADSVFQIAAHHDTVPLEELYEACSIARDMLRGPELGVSRVIARPFTGEPGSFRRTPFRKDFSLPPPGPTLLDLLAEAGVPATGTGKIDDLFDHRNIKTVHAGSNAEGLEILVSQIESDFRGFIFANLGDFDTKWGHRNDPEGFGAGLKEVDGAIPAILAGLDQGDLLIITADHGNDPTTPSTDHSREYVPLLAHSPGHRGRSLGLRNSLSDIACTLAGFFGTDHGFPGESFLETVRSPDGKQ